jgi:RNA polymerase sigma-70 factor (ECF subfamily)
MSQDSSTDARFENTHWTNIRSASDRQTPGAQAALEQLCKAYWPPLYAFIRKQGRSADDAKDLTQGFFIHLLSRNGLQNVHPQKGKFRSFLLAALNNYMRNERDKQQAGKRGGGEAPLPFEIVNAEETRGWEPADERDPAKAFERAWASTLLSEVLRQLGNKCAADGKSGLFTVLCPFLTGETVQGGYSGAALKLQVSEGAARTATTRLRKDFRELLRAEVARTVSRPEEIDEEINYLISVLRQPAH